MNKGTKIMMGIWAVLALVILTMGFFAVTPTVAPVLWYVINGLFGVLNVTVIVAFGVLIHNAKNEESNVQLQETSKSDSTETN